MRISNKMLHENFLKNLFNSKDKLSTLQQQISSGKQFDRPSQNVIGSSHSVILNKMINFNSRLLENVEYADSTAKMADAELDSVDEVLQRARELAIKAANETNSKESYNAIYQEVQALLDRTIEVSNSNPNGMYIWGGFQTDKKPFQENKDIVMSGTVLGLLNLDTQLKGTHSNKVEAISSGAVSAGALAFPTESLIINGLDMGSFNAADTARSSLDNAQTIVDIINSKTGKTGVTARVINPDTGTFSNPNTAMMADGDNYGIALSNQVVMQGGINNVGAAGGALGVGDLIINGVDIAQVNGGAIALPGGNQANADALITAINGAADLTGVTATTNIEFDNLGVPLPRRLILNTQEPKMTLTTTAAAVAATGFQSAAGTDTYSNIYNLPLEQPIQVEGRDNGLITKLRNISVPLKTINAFGNNPVTAGAYSIATGEIVITDENKNTYNVGSINCNGTSEQNALAIADGINKIANSTGVYASTNSAGRLVLNSVLGKEFSITTAGNGANSNLTNDWYAHLKSLAVAAQPPSVAAQTLGAGYTFDPTTGTITIAAGSSLIGSPSPFAAGSVVDFDATSGVGAAIKRGTVSSVTMAGANIAAGDTITVTGVGSSPLPAAIAATLNDSILSPGMQYLNKGSLSINGINIVTADTAVDFSSAAQGLEQIAKLINQKKDKTGVIATVEDLGGGNGRLMFGNTATITTDVKYIGDTGENYASIGTNEKIALNISGDKAFGGNQSVVQVMSTVDMPSGAALNIATLNLQINGVDIGAVNAPTVAAGPPQTKANMDALINAINSQSNLTGVTAKVDTTGSRVIMYTKGQDIQVSSNNAATLFAQTGLQTGLTNNNLTVFGALIRLRDQIMNNIDSRDPIAHISEINLKEIDEALSNVVINRTELGSRSERLEMTTKRINFTNITLQEQLANVQDTDIAKAASDLTLEDTIYNSALAVAAKILPQSLINYLS